MSKIADATLHVANKIAVRIQMWLGLIAVVKNRNRSFSDASIILYIYCIYRTCTGTKCTCISAAL